MIIDDFKVWMICLGNDPRRDIVLPSWSGYDVNCFEAITPDTRHLVKEKLDFGDKVRHDYTIKPFSEAEKSLFTSHLLLWKKCCQLKEPFLILEEDVMLEKPIPNSLDFQGLIPIANRSKGSKIVTPAAGYIIQPMHAKKMYEYFVVRKHKITYNVDHVIESRSDQHEWGRHAYAYQIEGESSVAHF